MRKSIITVLSVLILVLSGCSEVNVDAQDKDKEEVAQKDAPFKATEEGIKTLVADELKEKGTDDTDKLSSLEISDDVDNENKNIKTVNLELNGSNNLTNNMVKKGMLKEAEKLFPRIFEDASVGRVIITWKFPLEDAKGNTSFQKVLSIQLERKTADEINWDKFKYKNFETVADHYFEHAVFKE
ncbi:hypothetical protein OB894_01685 [Bacillus subtilis]|uniref:hypothetical protein n=1 Tax=Bacillus TaxID=1386 RepID=UPI001375185F|nr:hypothetical protein [Bacillus velezensis]WED89320.1 hypothetical protein PXG99_09620 [Bacillus velezensis]WFB52502.1 hypothetical protein P0M29_18040 [Bacillus velezensis]